MSRFLNSKFTVFAVLILLPHFYYAQDETEEYDDEHIQSTLVNFSRLNFSTEGYEFNNNKYTTLLVANGRIELDKNDYLTLEVNGVRYGEDFVIYYSFADFSISYSRNFYSANYKEPGFQGWTPSLKLIFPTGDPDIPAVFGHWIIEPSIYYSWLFSNEKFFLSNRWRLFQPMINAKEAADPPHFLRYEVRSGYENDDFWGSITFDNRAVFNLKTYVLMLRLDVGIKINDTNGLSLFYRKRIVGNVLAKAYAGLSYYHNFTK